MQLMQRLRDVMPRCMCLHLGTRGTEQVAIVYVVLVQGAKLPEPAVAPQSLASPQTLSRVQLRKGLPPLKTCEVRSVSCRLTDQPDQYSETGPRPVN